jgi:hypothetical protein
MTVKVKMPSGADEKVSPGAVYTIRDATDIERNELPEAISCIWGGGFRIYPAESLTALVEKFAALKLARLTSPGGMAMLINASNVKDCDDGSAIVDHPNTRSVLSFGTGATAPRIRLREARSDLIIVWSKLGLNIGVFE